MADVSSLLEPLGVTTSKPGDRRVWIVDDNARLASLIVELVGKEPGIHFEQQFGSAESLLQALQRGESPHVVLMDIEMGGLSGLEALKLVRQFHPEVAVVIMTAFFDVNYCQRAKAWGAANFLVKSASIEEFSRALRGAQPQPLLEEQTVTPTPAAGLAPAVSRWRAFLQLAREFLAPGEFKA